MANGQRQGTAGPSIVPRTGIPVIDELNGFVGTLHIEDGQDGAEDLLLHDGIGFLHVHQDGGLNETLAGIVVTANGYTT